MQKPLEFGWARERITPDRAVGLTGIAGSRLGLQVLDDLWVNALLFHDGSTGIVILSFDLLYVSRDLEKSLSDHVAAWGAFASFGLLCAATHTHCGPAVRSDIADGCVVDEAVRADIERKAKLALDQARRALQPVRCVELCAPPTAVNINRRRRILDRGALRVGRLAWQTAIRPNRIGPRDDRVAAMRVTTQDDRRIVMLTAACHPSLIRDNVYSADFPGALGACAREAGFADEVVFLQGFSGDSRARILQTAPLKLWPLAGIYEFLFDRSQFQKALNGRDAEGLARQLCDDVKNAVWQPADPLPLLSRHAEIRLPLETLQLQPQSTGSATQDAEASAKMQMVACHIVGLRFGTSLCIVGVEGEPFTEYALWIRRLMQKHGYAVVAAVGCAGGCVGYLPDADGFANGGYEVDRSRPMFGLPARFSPMIEGTIKTAMADVLGVDATTSSRAVR